MNVLKKYIKEVIEECRKLIFPTKKDVYVTSIYIGIIVLVTTMAIVLADFLISQIIKLIFGIGN